MAGWLVRARVVFAVLWFGAQGALVWTAPRRADRAFGFQMFNESSTLEIRLLREVSGPEGPALQDTGDGVWTTHDTAGLSHKVRWHDRVPQPALSTFGVPLHASYGADAQLARLQLALDDVVAHLGDDVETKRLAMDVVVRKNGHEAVKVRLWSKPR